MTTWPTCPPCHADEVKQQIRLGFEAHRGETEEYACKYLLSDGRAQLKQLRETLMLQE
jgi:Complex 1 protein (LYR family)